MADKETSKIRSFSANDSSPGAPSTEKIRTPVCGIIMPISATGNYPAEHWSLVKTIISRAIDAAGYRARLVSESESIGVIQAEIVQNLYEDEIVVCDVSSKNPNVMFELGMRLAFDKPVVIIKDDVTDYSFDTSPVKHLGYRRDLRYDDVEEFQKKVSAAIISTINDAQNNPNYSPFLKHFGKMTLKELESKEVDGVEIVLDRISKIQDGLTLNNKLVHSIVAEMDAIISSRNANNLVYPALGAIPEMPSTAEVARGAELGGVFVTAAMKHRPPK